MKVSSQPVVYRAPSLVPAEPGVGLVWERLPVVADASTLISDSLRFVRRDREPILLGLARRPALVNLYATASVRGEVEEHLVEAAKSNRLPVELVQRVWREEVAPAVRFVAVAEFPASDPRVARLAEVDPDDAPTGSLAELLGPCLVFSSDPHLMDSGIARNDWGNLMTQTLEVGMYQAGVSGTVVVTVLVIGLGVEAGSAVIGVARRWPLAALLLGGGGAFLLCAYWQGERGARHRGEVRSLLAEVGSRVGPFIARSYECQQLLERAAFVPAGDPSPLAAVARVVAAAHGPLWPSEIAARLGLSTQRVTPVLRHRIFTRTADRGYLLGLPGIPATLAPGT